ncbi:inorganic phosphate transporter [Clostridium sp. 19966]|uniref:inorganic phosphate transporter n=1 Tax=Clostridium sp. 19966 TaxID=2768166 RepID=UPI0028DE67EF|nr:anion permease [Clostridium sp. 19966]MDT8718080.1 inorganic phosphate transporter [Clostridium sp. 19966]
MHNSAFIITAVIVVLALCFDFINGFHDTANSIATSVSTRVLTPKQAILMSAVLNFTGAFISVSVAKTVGSDIVKPELVPQTVMVAALIGAIVWNLITWYFGIPSSSSHALIGGLIGAAIVAKGTINIVQWGNFFSKILLWLFLSPVIGFVIGYIIMIALNWILRKTRPATVTKFFSKAQIASAALMAFNHGGNDAQKSMGIITAALVSGGFLGEFNVPVEVKIACAGAMAIGTSIGGWKIIKTMGVNMARLAPVNGFAAETGAAAVIFTATMLHSPVSTTHIISGSIMGVGASKRLSSVRWVLAQNIAYTWVLTIPTCIVISGIAMFIFKLA